MFEMGRGHEDEVRRQFLKRGDVSDGTEDLLDEYALIRSGCVDIRHAAERIGVPFRRLDKLLYRTRMRGDSRGNPPPEQFERALLRGQPFRLAARQEAAS